MQIHGGRPVYVYYVGIDMIAKKYESTFRKTLFTIKSRRKTLLDKSDIK